MKTNKLLLISMFALPTIGFAQSNWTAGIKVGAATGLCDIGGINNAGRTFILDMQPSQIRWDLGAFARYKLSKAFSLEAVGEWTRLQGFDSLSKVQSHRDRNLNYRDNILELSVRAQWNFYCNPDVGGNLNYNTTFNAYVFLGLGMFHMNPESMYPVNYTDPASGTTYTKGTWTPLRNLTTEGEAPYNLIQAAIPMGVGFYYTINHRWTLGWDICYDKTFTDYIDDVSGKYPSYADIKTLPNAANKYSTNWSRFVPGITPQELANYAPGQMRGNPDNKDAFVTSSINVGYVFGRNRNTSSTPMNFFHKVNYKSRASF
jgi:hypothetical protein